MRKIFFLAPLVFSLITGFISGYAYQLYLGREECLKAAFPEASYDLSPEEIESITRALNAQDNTPPPEPGGSGYSSQEENNPNPLSRGVAECLPAGEAGNEDGACGTDEKLYVGSKNSNKIYPVDCRYAKLIKEENKVFFETVEEGEKQGKTYIECK